MSRFLYMQCTHSNMAYPRWAKRWVNIRKVFCNAYHVQRAGVPTMLEVLGLAFEGHLHSGIDDARNIARILAQLIVDGCNVYENEKLLLNSATAADDVQTAEVAVLQAEEVNSLDDDDGELASKEGRVADDSVSPQKTVSANNFSEFSGWPMPVEQASDETRNCADLLERLSF